MHSKWQTSKQHIFLTVSWFFKLLNYMRFIVTLIFSTILVGSLVAQTLVVPEEEVDFVSKNIIDKEKKTDDAKLNEDDAAFLLKMRGQKPPKTSSKDIYYVNASTHVRGKPYEAEKYLIAAVNPQDRVELIQLYEDFSAEKDEDVLWAKIRLPDGREGYILERQLQKSKPNIRARTPLAYVAKSYYVSSTSLRMREEPDVYSSRVTTLPHAAKVRITRFDEDDDFVDGKVARWAYGEWNGYEGWLFSYYLSDDKPRSKSDNVDEDPNHIHSGTTKYVKTKYLRMRDEPSKYGAVIGFLSHRDRVEIIERSSISKKVIGISSIWVKIRAGNLTGWVYGGFLTGIKGNYLASDDLDVPFILPINKVHFSRRIGKYGPRRHPVKKRPSFHTGIDVGGQKYEPIFAAGDGKIVVTKRSKAYGNLTVIHHDNGLYTYYAHQVKFVKKQGDRVRAGDTIGLCGSTGYSTGPHLHFEVRKELWRGHMNPLKYLPVQKED